MQILSKKIAQGLVRIKTTSLDDLWHISQLIEPGDSLKGKTTRKIKIGNQENAQTVKKTYTLTIEAVTVNYEPASQIVRVNGKIKQGPEELPLESHQSIPIDQNTEFELTKTSWPKYMLERLEQAAKKREPQIICLFDRDEALIAQPTSQGITVLTKISGEVTKKNIEQQITKDFYKQILALIQEYNQRLKPSHIIMASPAFYKDEMQKRINDQELRKKIIYTTATNIDKSEISRVLKRPEVAKALQDSQHRKDALLIQDLLTAIHKEEPVAYGREQTRKAIEAGAAKVVLVSDHLFEKAREQQTYKALEESLKLAESTGAQVHILSKTSEQTKHLDALGAIAAILRYHFS